MNFDACKNCSNGDTVFLLHDCFSGIFSFWGFQIHKDDYFSVRQGRVSIDQTMNHILWLLSDQLSRTLDPMILTFHVPPLEGRDHVISIGQANFEKYQKIAESRHTEDYKYFVLQEPPIFLVFFWISWPNYRNQIQNHWISIPYRLYGIVYTIWTLYLGHVLKQL